jgi:hypothetical protein
MTQGMARDKFLIEQFCMPNIERSLSTNRKATGLGNEPGSPLFPAALGKTGKLSRRPLVRTDAADILKRRLKQCGVAGSLFASLLTGHRPHELSGK